MDVRRREYLRPHGSMEHNCQQRIRSCQAGVTNFALPLRWGQEIMAVRTLEKFSTHFFSSLKRSLELAHVLNAFPFRCFLQDLQRQYHTVPYHNYIHAADVLSSCTYFLSQDGIDLNGLEGNAWFAKCKALKWISA